MHRPIATSFFASVFAAAAMSSQEPAGKYPLMEGIAQKVIQKYQKFFVRAARGRKAAAAKSKTGADEGEGVRATAQGSRDA